MKLNFIMRLMKKYALALVIEYQDELVNYIDYYIDEGSEVAVSAICDWAEDLPSRSLFQKFIKWIVKEIIKDNKEAIMAIVDEYSDDGAAAIVDRLIYMLKEA